MAPFAAFVGFMAIEKSLPIAPGTLYSVRAALSLIAIVVFSRGVIPWPPNQASASVGLGVAVFFLWIGPDLLWPGMRHHWLFNNSILGSPTSTLPQGLKVSASFIAVRVFGSVVLVPILEELFWRGWLMRWLIAQDFRKVRLGTYSALSFWATAALFASEHGSYWDVGLITGIVYNWWLIRTGNLANCVLAHAVTNGCLAVYVVRWDQWQYWL